MMDKERMATQEKQIKWHRPPLDKETLLRLRARSDAKGFIQVISRLLLSVVTGALAVYSWRNFAWP